MVDQKPAAPEKPQEPAKEQAQAAPPEPGKALPPEVKQSLEEAHKERVKMGKELGLPAKTPFGPAPEKPGTPEKPASPGEGKAAPAEGQKPEQQKPPEGAKKEGEKVAIPTKEELGRMSMGELLGKLVESGVSLVGSFTKFFEGGLGKLTEKATNRFSDEELKKISVNLNKEKDKIYPNQDKSVEYVAAVLGLPLKENPQKFLDALKNSGMVFETSQDKLKDVQAGDIVFFNKEAKKGEAYLCAVVSSVEPMMVKIIPRSGGAPQELDLKQSDYFKNEWFGVVKLPRKGQQPKGQLAPTAAPAAGQPPAAPPEKPSAEPPAQPAPPAPQAPK